jgi:16S rRNA (adenine1518-N6/adenine1519-N6)-dimethyltransferase
MAISQSPNPRKRFGQHWLRSPHILTQIVAAANLSQGDRLLEIGPGTGLLTQRLLPLVNSLIAVEIDRDLHTLLAKTFCNQPSLLLLEADCLTIDLGAIAQQYPDWGYPNKVVANIPYYITGPILEKLLGTIVHPYPRPFDSLVLLIQREVADRLCAQAGSKTFGALSVRVQYLATCELICPVPANAFEPPPKVESAVVRLTPRAFPVVAENTVWLEHLIKQGFSAKRKMLRNNLKGIMERDRLLAELEALGLCPEVRAEDINVEQWVRLSNQLIDLAPSHHLAHPSE